MASNIRRQQVFVSSTYVDLIDERQRVLHTLIGMGCFPAGMEFFPADSESAWNHVRQVIEDSDIYILIVGGRYGSTDEQGLSFTEKEYDYAQSIHLPILVFLHGDPSSLAVRDSETNRNRAKRLSLFRKHLEQEHLCEYWRSADELATKVAIALNSLMQETPLRGWSRVATDDYGVPNAMAFHILSHIERSHLTLKGFVNYLDVHVRAIANGAEVFYRQTEAIYPSTLATLKCLSPEMTVLRPPITKGNAQKYFIHVGRELCEGEETTVKLEEEYVQNGPFVAMNPYGYMAMRELNYLLESVSYDPVMQPDYVLAQTFDGDPEGGKLIESIEVKPSEGAYTMEVTAPKLGFTYLLNVIYYEETLAAIEEERVKQDGAKSDG